MIVVAAKRLVERESCVVVVYKLVIQVRGEMHLRFGFEICRVSLYRYPLPSFESQYVYFGR